MYICHPATLSSDRKKIFDLLNKLQGFDDKQDSFLKRLNICLSKYFGENFDLFPCVLKTIDEIKDKEEWIKELDEVFCERMNKIVNEIGYFLWATKNEEMVKVQLFYKTVRKDFVDFETIATFLITVQREVISFDWPNDTNFNEWKDKLVSVEQMEEGDDADDDAEVTATPANDDKDKEDPQDKKDQ